MDQNDDTITGAISITGGGTINFDTIIMTNNYGTTASDIYFYSCLTCVITFTNSTFTRDAVVTTGSDDYTNSCAISAVSGGTLILDD
jgi:hypothetical protein